MLRCIHKLFTKICDSKPSRNMQVFVHIFKLAKMMCDCQDFREYKHMVHDVYDKRLMKVLISVCRTRDPLLFFSLRLLRLLSCHSKFYDDAATLHFGPVLIEVFGATETKSQLAEASALLRVLSEGPRPFCRALVGPTGGLAVALIQLLRFPLSRQTPGVVMDLLNTILNLTGSRSFCEVLKLKGFGEYAESISTSSFTTKSCDTVLDLQICQKMCQEILRYGRMKKTKKSPR
eukprot:jgi/Bigna1/88171/estExt_fgenesh1_pg.C_280216